MTHVGFLYNGGSGRGPAQTFSNSVFNRAILIDAFLRRSGDRLFVYSPHAIVDIATDVPGYVIEDRSFIAASAPVPRVNANWVYRFRRLMDKGMGYRRFRRWTKRNDVGIYVPFEFAALASDKLRTYEAVREFDPALHPHTERYAGSVEQLESFLERGEAVFIKSRWGSQGNRIFVLRREGGRLSLARYGSGDREVRELPTPERVVGILDAAAARRPYVVQEGVNTMRCDGSAFDIRVIVLDDGRAWQCITEARIGAPGSDVSNIHQGGRFLAPEDVLPALFGPARAAQIVDTMVRTAESLAAHLDRGFPGQLMEIALDFMLDPAGELYLAEINTKPGMAGIGFFSTVFDMTGEDQDALAKYVLPHTTSLARFLRGKLDALDDVSSARVA